MAWSIRWLPPAERDFATLERHVATRVMARLEAAAQNPFRFFSRLKGREEYTLRVGDYRVLVLIIPSDRVVFVQTVDHRSTVYRKR